MYTLHVTSCDISFSLLKRQMELLMKSNKCCCVPEHPENKKGSLAWNLWALVLHFILWIPWQFVFIYRVMNLKTHVVCVHNLETTTTTHY